ncbi:unnamed protein product [Caenorhabditis nigoni]
MSTRTQPPKPPTPTVPTPKPTMPGRRQKFADTEANNNIITNDTSLTATNQANGSPQQELEFQQVLRTAEIPVVE